eukprot:gene15495-biopygen9716
MGKQAGTETGTIAVRERYRGAAPRSLPIIPPTHNNVQTYPSGYGARLLSECALHAQVRTLPSAFSCQGGAPNPLSSSAFSPAGNRTRVTRVTGGYTNLYTTEDAAEPRPHPRIDWVLNKMDTEGFEPSTSRMRNGRSSTELSARHHTSKSRHQRDSNPRPYAYWAYALTN